MDELQLSKDINILTAEINSYKNVAGQAIFEIGRRLKYVKENDLVHGEWESWCKDTINITPQYANKYIKVFNEFDGVNRIPSFDLGIKALYEISTMPEEERAKSHTIPSTGETKTVDGMTVKELREVKQALKEKEDQIKLLEEDKNKLSIKLTEEKNKPVKVETKYIEKEIDNTDYDSINKLHKQLEQKQKSYILLENEKKALENKMKLTETENKEFQSLKNQIQYLMQEKEDISRQIESATSISGLVVEVNHFIKEKLAPVKYSRAIQEMSDDEIVIKNLEDIITSVQSWCDEMKTHLPNTRKIINMEVL